MAKVTLGSGAKKLHQGDSLALLHIDDISVFPLEEFPEIGIISEHDAGKLKDFDLLLSDNATIRIDKVGRKLKKNLTDEHSILLHSRGIFCTLTEGVIKERELEFTVNEKIFNSLVVTLSDRAYNGIYEDRSGPVICEFLEKEFKSRNKRFQIDYKLIPDDRDELQTLLEKSRSDYDVIITTGGTGIGPRDFTVDVVQKLMDMEIPGIMEMIRMKYGTQKPNAYLSRGVAGIFGSALIYTLPGSVKAVNEYMSEICQTLDHLFYMKAGIDVH